MAGSESPVVAVSSGTPAALARAWLWLGVLALIGSGLLAMLLVLSRTPGIQDIFPLKGLFRAALVVHVDLSVAVWFMAFAAVIWSAVGRAGLAWLGWSGFGLAVLGTLLMTVSRRAPDPQQLHPGPRATRVLCFVVDLWRRFQPRGVAGAAHDLAAARVCRAIAAWRILQCGCRLSCAGRLLLVLVDGSAHRG